MRFVIFPLYRLERKVRFYNHLPRSSGWGDHQFWEIFILRIVSVRFERIARLKETSHRAAWSNRHGHISTRHQIQRKEGGNVELFFLLTSSHLLCQEKNRTLRSTWQERQFFMCKKWCFLFWWHIEGLLLCQIFSFYLLFGFDHCKRRLIADSICCWVSWLYS